MAKGDRVGDMTSLNATGEYSIRPNAGITWLIQNIYYDKGVDLISVESTNKLVFKSTSDKGSQENKNYHVSNDNYIIVRAKNDTTLVAFDGFITSA